MTLMKMTKTIRHEVAVFKTIGGEMKLKRINELNFNQRPTFGCDTNFIRLIAIYTYFHLLRYAMASSFKKSIVDIMNLQKNRPQRPADRKTRKLFTGKQCVFH